jgi:hypothetical protein
VYLTYYMHKRLIVEGKFASLYVTTAYGGVEVYLIITVVVNGVLSFTRCSLYHRESFPVTNRVGGWVVPRAGLDTGEERNPLPASGIDPQSHGSQRVLIFAKFLTHDISKRYLHNSRCTVKQT